MGISKEFTKAVFSLVQERLTSLGFRKRKPEILSLAISEEVLGLVGLNKSASGRGEGVLEVNPVIGVRNQRVERLVAELLGEPFDELNPFSAGANVGYLSPRSSYQPFLFIEGSDIEGPASELADAVRMWGIPFITSNASLPILLDSMRSTRLAIQIVAVYRIPVAMHLLGDDAGADTFLEEESAKLGARTDPAAKRFRVFASRFRERNHS